MVTSRTILQSDSDFYVSQTGDDNNSGATSLAPKKTIQAMMNTLFQQYDHGGVRVRVNLAASATPYAGFSTRGAWVGHYGNPLIGGATPTFDLIGPNTADPSQVTIKGIGIPAVQTVVGKSLHLDALTVSSDTSYGVHAFLTGSEIVLHNINFATCGDSMIYAQGKGTVIFTSGNTLRIVGNAPRFAYADRGEIDLSNTPVVASGPVTFSDFFVGAARNGNLLASPGSFSGGPVTGARWAVARGGQIDTGGVNPDTLFPGSTNGNVRIGGGFCG